MEDPEDTLRARLDERYALILQAIKQKGGSASTSEIKALTGIQTNQIITQRMDRLREWDLVTTTYRDESGNPQQIPTKVASLTMYGRQVAESGLLDDLIHYNERVTDVDSLNTEVSMLKRRVAQQEDRLRAVEKYLREEVNLDLDDYLSN